MHTVEQQESFYKGSTYTRLDAITEVEKLSAAQQLYCHNHSIFNRQHDVKSRRTNVFNAKNQDTSHDTALTSDVMNVMNMDISSWTALT